MKMFRRAAVLLCVIAALSCAFPAYAADNTVLEQYASELSRYTTLKYYHPENTNRYLEYKFSFPDCAWETIITNVNIGLDRDYYSQPVTVSQPDSLNVLVNKYRKLTSGYVPKNLEAISPKYSFETIKLTSEARVAFEKMCADANALGYGLYATSGYRSYARQQSLYAEKPYDSLTARPGFSEHQTGLAVDVIHGLHRTNENLVTSPVYKWYNANAYKYGFIVRYSTAGVYQTGCSFEPWHLRYLGVELAAAVYNSGLTYDEYYMREIDVKNEAQAAVTTAVGVTCLENITVNGTAYTLSAYHIMGDTYCKLRDIAILFNGSPLQFDVSWDSATKQAGLIEGSPYTAEPVLGVFDTGLVSNVTLSESSLQLGGGTAELTAYLIGGSNFYRLGDILGLLGYALPAMEENADCIIIDTSTLVPIPASPIGEPPSPAEEPASGETESQNGM